MTDCDAPEPSDGEIPRLEARIKELEKHIKEARNLLITVYWTSQGYDWRDGATRWLGKTEGLGV